MSANRRQFLKKTAVNSSLLCGLAAPFEELLDAQSPVQPRYDLVIKGGRLVDPSQGPSAERDIAISGHTIARVAPDIGEAGARHVLNARGKIVTPGLIDLHVHVYDGVAPLGIPADPNSIAKGVTPVLDGGSAGAHTCPGFRQYVV